MIKDNGTFEVGDHCRNCTECNTVARIHPFGSGRLRELTQ